MLEHDPSALRKVYFEAWHKAQNNQALSAMEVLIVDIIQRHPEYHPIFSDQRNFDQLQHEKFALDHNPFFHLALHITIAEQVSTDKPAGVRAVYQKLLHKIGDQTASEHKMIECLARVLVDSFKRGDDANEVLYLEALQRLV